MWLLYFGFFRDGAIRIGYDKRYEEQKSENEANNAPSEADCLSRSVLFPCCARALIAPSNRLAKLERWAEKAMKRILIPVIVLFSLSYTLAGGIRFNGYVREGDAYIFSLNSEGGKDGGWYSLGEQIGGQVIKDFNQNTRRLTLTGPGGEIAVPLVESRTGLSSNWDISKREELTQQIIAMGPSLGNPERQIKLYSAEDYIALGTSYGLVISREMVENTEIIGMRAPDVEARKLQSPPSVITKFKIKTPSYQKKVARKIEIEIEI